MPDTHAPHSATECLLRLHDEHYDLEDYQSGVPRWCTGCGDNAILTAVQRLCRDEELPPEKTVFISGIGCSSRFPHYMKTYGLHGIHGRALPIAEGVKMARPDLNVFVNTGDGDCCSIGAAHWIHAIRYNMNLTVMLHDNQIYGLTKMQASPTSPIGLKSNTTPRGVVSGGAEPADRHAGRAERFVRGAGGRLDSRRAVRRDLRRRSTTRAWASCASCSAARNGCRRCSSRSCRTRRASSCCTIARGLTLSPGTAKIYRTQEEHDPGNLDRAREIASGHDPIPVGILYHNPDVPCYEEVRHAGALRSAELIRNGLEAEFDKFTIWPAGAGPDARGAAAG